MQIIFGGNLKKMPFSAAIPYNDDDLMIMINPFYGIRLNNIHQETGVQLKIKSIMEKKKDIFGEKSLDDRLKDVNSIMSGRFERYFITKKSKYIFFDKEEQRFLRKIFSAPGLSCEVTIHKYSDEGWSRPIRLLDLTYKESIKITRFLSNHYVQTVLDSKEFYYTNKSNKDRFTYGFEDKKKFGAMSNEYNKLAIFFNRYKKLSNLGSKKKVDKYFKMLTVKYHPDRIETGDEQICMQVRCDYLEIKETKWYETLPDTEQNKKRNSERG